MVLSWSLRRQLLYYAVGGVILLVIFIAGYQTFLTTPATCFDQKQNGDENGVDCGGACSLICSDVARAPVVLWARSFSISPKNYTAAAYIQNPNRTGGAQNVGYSFQLFDEKNLLVIERRGTIDLPPIQTIPIVEPNIDVGNRTVARTLFSFTSVPVWYKLSNPLPVITLSNQILSPDGSRLSLRLTNGSLNEVAGLTVAAVLFDSQGVARGASRSFIGRMDRKSSQEVTFTWPQGVEGVVRAEITVIPAF